MAKPKNTEKQKNKSTGKNILLVFVVILSIAAIISEGATSEKSNATEASTHVVAEATNEAVTENISETSTEAVTVAHRTGEEIVGISDKNIEDLSVEFYDSLSNDVTGNWRKAHINADIDINTYILSYFNKYFKDDSEIHIIVNPKTNTTTLLNYYGGNTIYITHHQYEKDDEKSNAKEILHGITLSKYWLYKDNGDIELVEYIKEAEEKSTETTGQKNALKSAKNYLRSMPFSYNGLVAQLEFEQYSHEEAIYAANNCGADWKIEALNAALNYLGTAPFSYSGLIEQLMFEGFTAEQAAYGADNCFADWNEQAAKSAKNYLSIMSFSKASLIEQLMFEGFTAEQAAYGAKENGY